MMLFKKILNIKIRPLYNKRRIFLLIDFKRIAKIKKIEIFILKSGIELF